MHRVDGLVSAVAYALFFARTFLPDVFSLTLSRFAFHLVDIIIQSDVLLGVLKSVTKNFRSFALTLFLLCLMVYAYAVLGYIFFGNNLYITPGNAEAGQQVCDNVAFVCFLWFFFFSNSKQIGRAHV